MLFDLRGRGRRRTVQVIYLSLAILMGGGLVLFGIGGGTNGGLFDAFGGSSNTTSTDAASDKRIAALDKRVAANPKDAAAWADLARQYFQRATASGENFNSTQGAYTRAGLDELGRASRAWQRHLALRPDDPNANVAGGMIQAYGESGLKQYPNAVRALEIVIDSRTPTPQLYAQLAIYAAAAKQDRKSSLAEAKAISLTPADQRKDFKAQIDAAKVQLTGASTTTTPGG